MDSIHKIQLLSQDMQIEKAEDLDCFQLSRKQQGAINIFQAQMPDGKQIKLLKTLLTSACERNCYYCPFRSGRDFRRNTLSPDEMARTFMALSRAGIAEGLFLSSGVISGGIVTQDKLIAAGEILRRKYNYRGYIHLKLMPGADREQIEATMQLADRVSINLEAPNEMRLNLLAPGKNFMEELLKPLRIADQIRRTITPNHSWNNRWPSMTTQFVLGAVGENDLEMLSITTELYRSFHLRRVYYSPFRPISGTPFEDRPPVSKIRERGLYQASYLIRDYGFQLEEFLFNPDGNLPADVDPKSAWADANLKSNPMEINLADRSQHLRIPGIGPKSADKILASRHTQRINEVSDLKNIGIDTKRALPYILMNGKRPPVQLGLF